MKENNVLLLPILSLVLGGVSWIAFWWLSIVGLILGIISLVDKNKTTTSTILSVIGTVVSTFSIVVVILGMIAQLV